MRKPNSMHDADAWTHDVRHTPLSRPQPRDESTGEEPALRPSGQTMALLGLLSMLDRIPAGACPRS